MLKTKYDFLKKLYPNDAIVFLKNKKYYFLYDDLFFTKYFKTKGLIKNLEINHINYIILDNLDIIRRVTFDDNRYREIMIKGALIDRFKNIDKKKWHIYRPQNINYFYWLRCKCFKNK